MGCGEGEQPESSPDLFPGNKCTPYAISMCRLAMLSVRSLGLASIHNIRTDATSSDLDVTTDSCGNMLCP